MSTTFLGGDGFGFIGGGAGGGGGTGSSGTSGAVLSNTQPYGVMFEICLYV